MKYRVGRRLAAAAFAGGLMASGAVLAGGASPALATQDTDTQSVEVRAQQLPAPLKEAIKRDLGLSPTEYITQTDVATEAARVASQLSGELGEQFGGAWIKDGALNVAVTDDAAAKAAQAAGATPHKRGVNEAALEGALAAISKWAAGLEAEQAKLFHAVSADVTSGQVRVRLSDTEAGRALADKVPAAGGPEVVVDLAKGPAPVPFQQTLRGGEGIYMGADAADPNSIEGVCSAGFNAVNADGLGRVITAGHCVGDGDTSFVFTETSVPTPVGQVEAYQFGDGWDYASIQVDNGNVRLDPTVNNYDGQAVEVHGSADVVVGMEICKSGRTTGWTCGVVEQARVEVNSQLPDGSTRMVEVFQHDACSRPGDSGGSVIAGNTAVGLTQGGVPGTNPDLCPSEQGEENFSVSEHIVDVLNGFKDNGEPLYLLTTNGDQDSDGELDVDELSDNPTQKVDENGDGVASFLDADEPNLRAPALTSPADGDKIADHTPELVGTGKAQGSAPQAAEVTLAIDGGDPMTAAVDADGNWSVQVETELGFGAHEVTLSQTFGNTQSETVTSTFEVTIEAPVITSPEDGTESENARPDIAGTGIPGATLSVSVDGEEIGTTTVDENGDWGGALESDLSVGEHTISAAQTADESTSAAHSVTYTVTEPDGGGGGDDDGDLPNTGVSAIVPLTIGGLLAIAAGAGAVYFTRRRRSARSIA